MSPPLSGQIQQGDTPDLKIDVELAGGRHTLALRGELDLVSAPRLVDSVMRASEEGADEVVLDLTGLEFLDSTGLRAILDASAICEERGCRLRMAPAREQVPEQVRRLLQITGLLERLPFDDD